MTRVACAPAGTTIPDDTEIPFILYGYRSAAKEGSVGATIPSIIRALGLQPSARAWDFLSIALSVVAADEGASRSKSPDGWTRLINLTIAVIDPVFWSGCIGTLEEAFKFVTGDIWTVSFVGGGFLPAPVSAPKARPEDCICLLSGGMDSLIGALDLVALKRLPLLVSQIAKGDKADQKKFAAMVSPSSLHIQVNHNASPPGPSERSQRGRSMVFFGVGVLAATCLDSYNSAGAPIELFVPENGFISLNVPLTGLRIGSLSTRTTHPLYLAKLQSILERAGLNVAIRNPYQFRTKGEMLEACKNQPLLKQLIGSSTSCGRYARTGFKQCGRCVPCLVRRSSFQKWGVADPTPPYKYALLGTPGRKHIDFDDVRSVAAAVEVRRTRGIDAWIGGAINSAQIDNSKMAREVAERGLAELENFLTSQGVI